MMSNFCRIREVSQSQSNLNKDEDAKQIDNMDYGDDLDEKKLPGVSAMTSAGG